MPNSVVFAPSFFQQQVCVCVCRYVRISTWCGTWTYRPWTKKYCVGVEDPFDCTDNCARTIAPHASSSVANKFGDAVSAMALVDSTTVPSNAQDEGVVC